MRTLTDNIKFLAVAYRVRARRITLCINCWFISKNQPPSTFVAAPPKSFGALASKLGLDQKKFWHAVNVRFRVSYLYHTSSTMPNGTNSNQIISRSMLSSIYWTPIAHSPLHSRSTWFFEPHLLLRFAHLTFWPTALRSAARPDLRGDQGPRPPQSPPTDGLPVNRWFFFISSMIFNS